ncbi:MAG: lytic transglycosylase domain-containing protein [Clostridia bacterium]|nr:lytic transglycosylase domain-containing protein [Clostridia bacterium]
MLKNKNKVLIVFAILIILGFLAFIFFNVNGYKKYLKEIEYYSKLYGVEKHLVLAVIKTESNFNENAISNKGALGIMQIMPNTANFIAKKLGDSSYNLLDYKTSIKYGVYYLSYLKNKFNNEYEIICAYNAGEGRVLSWINLGILSENSVPFKETETYLKMVKLRKFLYSKLVN